MADSKSESKEFGLKPIETQLLNVIAQNMNALMSNTVSFIAMERLAVNITPNTRFNLNADMTKVTVSEEEPEAEAETGEIVETPTKGKK